MRKNCFFISLSVLVGFSASASTPAVVVSQRDLMLDPEIAVADVQYYDSNGTAVNKPWQAVPQVKLKELLSIGEALVEVSQKDQSGGFSILPVAVSAKKQDYRLIFRWMQYRPINCRPSNPAAGKIRVGVALEIVATFNSKEGGLDISGLGPLSFGAESKKITGGIAIRTIGLGSASPTLGSYLTKFELSRDGVNKALEAIAVTKAVLENEKTILTPYYLSQKEATSGACADRLPLKIKRSSG